MALAEDGSEKGPIQKLVNITGTFDYLWIKKYCTHSHSDKFQQSPNWASLLEETQ